MIPHDLALRVLRRLLRPAARLAVRCGLQLNEAIEALKSSLVEAAEESLATLEQEPSASKVSAMTGVHRKDIARLRHQTPPPSSSNSLISRLMVQWQHHERFSTKAGKPRVLSCEGRESEFASLVMSVNGGDISGYAVLFEMERRGIIERRGNTVRLSWRDFAPSDDRKAQLEQWGEDTVDLGLAVEENLFTDETVKNHHLKTSFDNLDQEQLPAIREWLLYEGSLFHRRVRQHLAQFDLDLNPTLAGKSGKGKIVFGSFSVSSHHSSRIKKERIAL